MAQVTATPSVTEPNRSITLTLNCAWQFPSGAGRSNFFATVRVAKKLLRPAPDGNCQAQLSVSVIDLFGSVTEGVAVTWAITSGGGGVSATSTTTDVTGTTSVTYTAGPTPGPATITATVVGIGTVTFSETIT